MIELPKQHVYLDESIHTYYDTRENGKTYEGVTGSLINYLFPGTYDGISEEVLRNAAERGKKIHKEIELAEMGVMPRSSESINYLTLVGKNDLTHVESEYIVTDYKQFAGSIDHVFLNDEGEVGLVDIKTISNRHDQRVKWQLSIYAYLFELCTKYKVRWIAEMWLRDEKAEFIPLQRLPNEKVQEVIDAYNEKRLYVPTETLPANVENLQATLKACDEIIKATQEKADECKAKLLAYMKENNVRQIKTEKLTATYSAPTTRMEFDKRKFVEENKELADKYMVEKEIKEQLRILIK